MPRQDFFGSCMGDGIEWDHARTLKMNKNLLKLSLDNGGEEGLVKQIFRVSVR